MEDGQDLIWVFFVNGDNTVGLFRSEGEALFHDDYIPSTWSAIILAALHIASFNQSCSVRTMFPRVQCSNSQTRMTIMPRRDHHQIHLLIREELLRLAVDIGIREIFFGGGTGLTVDGGFGVTLKEGVDGEVGGSEDEGEVEGTGGVSAENKVRAGMISDPGARSATGNVLTTRKILL